MNVCTEPDGDGPIELADYLAADTMLRLAQQFAKFAQDGHPHQPSMDQWHALEWLAEQLAKQAVGIADPVYHLSSLDPGVGKTQTLVAFIKTLLADARFDHVGIVVFANRLEELYTFPTEDTPEGGLVFDCFGDDLEGARAAGKFAVLTHDDDWNRLGCTPNRGRVLFTTQVRLLTGARDKGSFSAITDFHYQGRLRQVRVWDETILPGYPITLDPDEALGLVHPIRTRLRKADLSKALKADMASLDGWPADTLYQMRDWGTEFDIDQEDLISCAPWKSGLQKVAAALWLLRGQVGVVRRDDYTEGNTILSYAENLPADLPSMVIMDASGRCRQTYREWIKSRKELVEGPPAVKRYGNLTIHHWNRGGGKTSWRKSGTELLDGIVKMIASKPDHEEWLVVHHKPSFRRGIPNVPKRLRELVTNPERLSFVTWGAHSAVNRFSHIRNIVLAGILFLPDPAYEATARATIGSKPADQIEKPDVLDQIVIGEHRHAILQALCRGAVRTSKGATCGHCEAWVIGSSAKGIDRELLRSLFPGAKVADWTPDGKSRPKRQYELAAEAIAEWFEGHPEVGAKLTPAGAMRLIGITDKARFRKIRQHPEFHFLLCQANIQDGPGGFSRIFGTSPASSLAA
jgi:hypothetical protein